MAQAGWQDSGGGKRGKSKKPRVQKPQTLTELNEALTKHQGANAKQFMEHIANLGVKVPQQSKGKGKGKGKNDPQGAGQPNHPIHNAKQGQHSNNLPKGKGKGKGKDKSKVNLAGGDNASQSFYRSSGARSKVFISTKGNPNLQATMMTNDQTLRPIQFICHNQQCHLAHWAQRKECIACGTARDVGLEPTVYDPDVHNTFVAQRRINAMFAPAAAAASSNASRPQPSQAQTSAEATFPADWEPSPAVEVVDLDTPMEEEVQASALAATVRDEEETFKTWFPSCLTRSNVRLCLHEGSQEILRYKHLFNIQELAESELTAEIALLRKKLIAMQMEPTAFVLEMAHTKQLIVQLEEKRSREDASSHTGGEHHTTGGRLQMVLGNHISAMAREEEEHQHTMEDMESKIAALQAQMAAQERIQARKTAANEAFRDELQAKYASYTGPQKLMDQLHHSQATKKMDELADTAFSQEWLQANGMQSLVSPELIKVLVSQAMNVALKAQHMGINITPPGAGQQHANEQAAQPSAPNAASGAQQQAVAAQSQIPFAPQFVPGAFSGENQGASLSG
jgi:hypothetical protein